MVKRKGLRHFAVLLAAACTAGMLSVSCNNGTSEAIRSDSDNVTMNVAGMTRAASDNTRVYLFNDGHEGTFEQRVVNIGRVDENTLSMTIPARTWDMWLVATEDGSGMDEIVEPTAGQSRADQKMYELKPIGGVLPSAPILLTGAIDNRQVLPNQSQTADAELSRNVAMVMLEIKDPEDFDTNGTHTVELSNVPTTLDWNGELVPSRTAPKVGSSPMIGNFTFTEIGGGLQKSNIVEFIIPAHRMSSVTDTTTNLLKVSVDLELKSARRYVTEEPVVIPVAPVANGRLLVRLIPNVDGELVVESADILPWLDVTEDNDLYDDPYSELRVNKTSSEFAISDDLIVTSNKTPHADAVPGASWLMPTWLGDNHTLRITGDRHSYDGVERTSYVDLVVNNFTKRIPVSQKHSSESSISVSPEIVVLTPTSPQGMITVTTTPVLHQWDVSTGFLVAPGELTNSYVHYGTGTVAKDPIELSRKVHVTEQDKYAMYVDDTLRIHHTQTLQVKRVIVKNLFMQSEPVFINPPTGGGTTATVTSSNVEVFGGSKRFVVEGVSESWIREAECIVNTDPATKAETPYLLRLVTDYDGEERVGYVTISHADSPAGKPYTIDVEVRQEFHTEIPPFDFFVVNIDWAAGDIDVAVEFRDNNAPFDTAYETPFKPMSTTQYQMNADSTFVRTNNLKSNAMGWNLFRWVKLDGTHNAVGSFTGATNAETLDPATLLLWGGDAQSGQGETVFFKAPMISPATPAEDPVPTVARHMTMDVYASWYNGTVGDPVTVTVRTYEGGKMIKPAVTNTDKTISATNFYNVPEDYTGTLNETNAIEILNTPTFSEPFQRPVRTISSVRSVSIPGYYYGPSLSTTNRLFLPVADFRNYYTHIATIRYDRYKRTINIDWIEETRTPQGIVVPFLADPDPDVPRYVEDGKMLSKEMP